MRAALAGQLRAEGAASREASAGDSRTPSCRSRRSISRGSPEAIASSRGGQDGHEERVRGSGKRIRAQARHTLWPGVRGLGFRTSWKPTRRYDPYRPAVCGKIRYGLLADATVAV